MGKPPRITNRERVLLALQDAPDHIDQYEVPRRFSQPGLTQRLGMAQSHVSRALTQLLDEGLLTQKRKRVVGERRRVTTYSLSEKGMEKVRELASDIDSSEVLTTGVEGDLIQVELGKLIEEWVRAGDRSYPDALSKAELIRSATSHDGMLLVDSPNSGEGSEEADLSSETIGLHLELAELKRSQGDLRTAIDHLGRAADLHRKRGNPPGEARCILAAATLGGQVSEPESLVDSVMQLKDEGQRMDSLLTLFDLILHRNPTLADGLLDTLDTSHPPVALRSAEAAVLRGETVDMELIPVDWPDISDEERAIWIANRIRVHCMVAHSKGAGWPIPSAVTEALQGIGDAAPHRHPMLFAELTLAHVRNPVIPEDDLRDALQEAWAMRPPLPVAGHVGFQLASMLIPAEALVVLIELQRLFNDAGDVKGSRICAEWIERS